MIMRLFSDPSSLEDFMLQRSVEWRCAVTESITNGHNFKLPLLNIVSTGSFCRNQRISVPSKLDKICMYQQVKLCIIFSFKLLLAKIQLRLEIFLPILIIPSV